MKRIIGSICLALFCGGLAWFEYEMVLRLGSMPILFAVASVLSALLVALLRAPEGYERPDGFHVRTRNRRFGHIRPARLFQPARARGWR
jgi:hypothetical protein